MMNKLASIMGDRLLTISQLSKETGISRNTLARIRNKSMSDVNISTLIKISNYLNVPLHDIIDYFPKKEG